MASLKRRAESLTARKDLDEGVKHTLLQNLRSLEEEWKGVLQQAQELHGSVTIKYKPQTHRTKAEVLLQVC